MILLWGWGAGSRSLSHSQKSPLQSQMWGLLRLGLLRLLPHLLLFNKALRLGPPPPRLRPSLQ